jgi:hypothetical protein
MRASEVWRNGTLGIAESGGFGEIALPSAGILGGVAETFFL